MCCNIPQQIFCNLHPLMNYVTSWHDDINKETNLQLHQSECLLQIFFCCVLKRILVSIVQGACVKRLSSKGKLDDSRATKQLVALLSAPLEKYNDVVTALKLSNYPQVMKYLDSETNKVMASVIIQSIMKNNTYISTVDKVCFSPILFVVFKMSSSNLTSLFLIFFFHNVG